MEIHKETHHGKRSVCLEGGVGVGHGRPFLDEAYLRWAAGAVDKGEHCTRWAIIAVGGDPQHGIRRLNTGVAEPPADLAPVGRGDRAALENGEDLVFAEVVSYLVGNMDLQACRDFSPLTTRRR